MNRFLKHIAAAAACAGFACAALATPETYVLDPNHTFPHFSYSHLGYSIQRCRFNKTTGSVVLDKQAHTGSVEVTIDMTSVDTGSSLLNADIQGEDFLDTAKYPTATFKSTKVVFDGDKPDTVEGNLTIKGVTKPVTLKVNHFLATVHPMMKVNAIGADATTVVKRSEFNAGKYVPYVGDDVTITITLEAQAR